MKKTIIIAALALMLAAAGARAQDAAGIYKKYSGNPGVEAVYISPAMFRMIGELPEIPVDLNGDKVNLAPIIASLDGMYILDSSNAEVNSKLSEDIRSFVGKGTFELLMEAVDEEEKVSMYTDPDRRDTDMLNGFLLHVDSPGETTFIYIDGRMSRGDFEALVSSAMK